MEAVLCSPRPRALLAVFVLALAMSCLLAGCGGGTKVTLPDARVRLTQLQRLYAAYCEKHRKGPPNEQALLEFRDKLTPAEKEAYLISDDVQDIFTSPRDNQKFEVKYNVRIDPAQNKALAWEATGKDGKRFVALTIGYIEEYDDQTLADYKK
jgi:hypothetical protein